MANVYKQFTAQDKALIPFNAHKQYNFISALAASNSITYYSSQWTSESIDIYSSGSASADIINTIKYNQIDKLYYRNYLTQIHDKLGPIEYTKQPRNLYEKTNILSIPMGLYGNQIKPGSFYMSASKYEIIDDKFGNLLISGTLVDNYPNNIQQNVFRLDSIKGFKKYDLGVHEGYATISEEPHSVFVHTFSESDGGSGIGGHQSGGPKVFKKNKWRRGTRLDNNIPTAYTTGQRKPILFYPTDKDDSHFMNEIYYNNTTFNTSSLGNISHKFPKIFFNSISGSFISSSHSEKFNFQNKDDFSISFWIKPKGIIPQDHSGGIGLSTIENGFSIETYTPTPLVDDKKRFIITKSKTKTTHNIYNLSSSQDPQEAPAEVQFPYEIYMQSSSIYFNRSDGNITKSTTTELEGNWGNNLKPIHILCQNSGSVMQIYRNGSLQSSTTTAFKDETRNTANLYIGSMGKTTTIDQNGGIESSSIENGFVIGNYVNNTNNIHRHFNGDLNNINIWSRAYNLTTVKNISGSINGSPYIGNLFYQNGFASIIHPSYHNILNSTGIGNMSIEATDNAVTFTVNNNEINGINTLQFQGTHLIYEHEYQCTVEEHEFNSTTNLSARKLKSNTDSALSDFTTSSLFKPHVTTIGLYDDNNELLVIGKLGQPVRTSNETDTTFVLRWDT